MIHPIFAVNVMDVTPMDHRSDIQDANSVNGRVSYRPCSCTIVGSDTVNVERHKDELTTIKRLELR